MMKGAEGYRRFIWIAAAALIFGCSLITGSIPESLGRESAEDLNAFLPPSNTPFLPDLNAVDSASAIPPGDPSTATFTVAVVFSATVNPASTPTATLKMFPSQTPTVTVTVYILPTVTPTRKTPPQNSPVPTRMPYLSPTPTVAIPPADTPTTVPRSSSTPSPGGGVPTTAVPTATPLPTGTAWPTFTATVILQPSATGTAVPSSTGCVVYNYDYDSQTASLINAQRNSAGLPSLSVSGALTASARDHSVDMVTHNLTQHNGSDGSTPRQRMIRAGYTGSWWGEIIYWGSGSYGTPAKAVTWWMNDPPHKDIILGSAYTDFGVGYVYCSSFTYKSFFTVDFGGP
jgi:uncharacterized protein YkwD